MPPSALLSVLPSDGDFIDHANGRQRAQLRVAIFRIDRKVVLDLLQHAREFSELAVSSSFPDVMYASNAAL